MSAAKEILNAAGEAVWDARRLILLLVAGACAALVVGRVLERRTSRRVRAWTYRVGLAAALGVGLWLAWKTAFVCDDAFISFRYARNLAEGHGLVWNRGEWVEGYTNFLWTALLGGLGWLGASIPESALFGCLACFVIALWASAATVRKVSPSPPALPFAVIALAGSVPFHTFATSGLETMPGAMLVVVAMYASTRPRGALWSGLALTAAAMTRPDHVLFYACFGLAIALEDLIHDGRSFFRRLAFRRYFTYLAPFFLIFVPYYLIRWRVYGDFYPNTYYAKSGGASYWSQGGIYALHFSLGSGAWVWLWPAILALFGRPHGRDETRVRLFAGLAVPVFAAYVAKVGGDFMEWRFFVPLLPIVAVACETGLRWRLARPGRRLRFTLAGALAALALAAAVLPVHVVPDRGIRWGIANEPSFYRVRQVHPLIIECAWENLGKDLNASLVKKGVEPPLAAGAIGLLGYHSRLPLVDGMGLTNRTIAHKTIKGRGRVGHEKVASVPELIAEGAVVDVGFRFDPYFRDSALVRIGPSKLYFLRYDPRWAKAIGDLPGAQTPNPRADILDLVRKAPRERVLAGRKFYRDFLAIHPDRDELLDWIEERLSAIADFEGVLPPDTRTEERGLRLENRDRPPGATGDAWLGSLPDHKGNRVGKVEIPVGPLFADELRFVLGGKPSEKIGVRLVIDGQTVRQARPTGDPGMLPVVWRIDELRGDTGVLVIEDSDPAPGQGLVIDAVHLAPVAGDVRERITSYQGVFGASLGELLREARALLPPGDPDRDVLDERIALHVPFDKMPEGAEVTGAAFGKGPVGKALPGQDGVVGMEGLAFLNSGHGGDPAKGQIKLPEIVLPRDAITVLVAGGLSCNKVYVGLEVKGRVIARVCGKNDHSFRREELKTGSQAGKKGRIVIVDDSDGLWGHILVDDLLIPR